jgi:hypothetical protein
MKTLPDRSGKHQQGVEKDHLLQVRIPEQMFRNLRSIAGSRGMFASGLVRELINQFFARPENRRAS